MEKNFFIERLERMSEEQFQEARMTEEYRNLVTDPNAKNAMMAMLGRRRDNERKREKILEALYSNPQALGWIKDMENYRGLRIHQAWVSIAIGEGQRDASTRAVYEDLDRQRRTLHNKALTAFCRLVESTSPYGSNRSNVNPNDGSYFTLREARNGDLYEGPLMIPYEEENNYGKHEVRDAMTTGMFKFLKFIAETPRGDWDMLRDKVIDRAKASGRKNIDPSKLPNIGDLQTDLRRTPQQYGMSEAPETDEFSTDLFDRRDNKSGYGDEI